MQQQIFLKDNARQSGVRQNNSPCGHLFQVKMSELGTLKPHKTKEHQIRLINSLESEIIL